MINPDLSRSELDEFESIELYTKQYARLREDRMIQDFCLFILDLCRDIPSRGISNKHTLPVLFSSLLGRLFKWRVHCALQWTCFCNSVIMTHIFKNSLCPDQKISILLATQFSSLTTDLEAQCRETSVMTCRSIRLAQSTTKHVKASFFEKDVLALSPSLYHYKSREVIP